MNGTEKLTETRTIHDPKPPNYTSNSLWLVEFKRKHSSLDLRVITSRENGPPPQGAWYKIGISHRHGL